jgi:hypothetical protein
MPKNQKFILSTSLHPLYEQGVEYSAQAAMERRRPENAPQTARFDGQAGARFSLTVWLRGGNVSGMLLRPMSIVSLVSTRLNPHGIL